MTIQQIMGRGLPFCLALTLAACGGTVSDGAAPSAGGVTPSSGTVLQGVYSVTLENKEFLSVITPELDWYALYFERLAYGNPDIFSGKLSLGVDGRAAISSVHAFQIAKSALPLTGSASISAATLQGYSVNLTGITSARGDSLSFSVAALAPTSYNPGKAASYADLQGTPGWQGSWYDGDTSNLSSLQFSSNGSVSSVSALNYCDLSSLTLAPLSGVNLFRVTLNIPVKGLGGICLRSKDRLTGVDLGGVAFLSRSPLAGKSWRLDLIAVDSAGSGISFRGDR